MTMAAGRKSTVAKRGATNAHRGRAPIKVARPKTKVRALPKTPKQKVAKKAARGRTQPRRASSSRTPIQIAPAIAAQIETLAQELGEIREIRAELKDLRGLIEVLTSMVAGLMATERPHDDNPEREVMSEEHQAPVEDAVEPDTTGDLNIPETAESMPSDL